MAVLPVLVSCPTYLIFDAHLHSSYSLPQSHLVLSLLLLFMTPSQFFQGISVLINPKHSHSFHLSLAVLSIRQLYNLRTSTTRFRNVAWYCFRKWSSTLKDAPGHHYQENEFDFITLILGHIYLQQKIAYVIGITIMDGWGRAQAHNRKAFSCQRRGSLK